jgi:hypothetical protein
MNDHDTTARAASPYPRGQLPDLRCCVNSALAKAGSFPANDRVRAALDDYIRDPDGVGALILMGALESVVGESAARDALDMKPPQPGLVYCCPTMGWVTPRERDEHRYDSSFGWDD